MNTSYKKATLGARFLAIFIDGIVLTILATIFTTIITMAAKIEQPEFDGVFSENVEQTLVDFVNHSNRIAVKVEEFNEETAIYVATLDYEDLIEYASDVVGSPSVAELESAYNYCQNYAQKAVAATYKQLAISFAISLVLFVIYCPIIGSLWRKQTLGRLISGIRVINPDGNYPSFSKLLVRDVVGFFLFNLLNFCCFIPVIINIVLLAGVEKNSVGDKISGTMMVCVDKDGNPISLDNGSNPNNDFSNQYNGPVVDADVVDSKAQNTTEENKEEDSQGV